MKSHKARPLNSLQRSQVHKITRSVWRSLLKGEVEDALIEAEQSHDKFRASRLIEAVDRLTSIDNIKAMSVKDITLNLLRAIDGLTYWEARSVLDTWDYAILLKYKATHPQE